MKKIFLLPLALLLTSCIQFSTKKAIPNGGSSSNNNDNKELKYNRYDNNIGYQFNANDDLFDIYYYGEEIIMVDEQIVVEKEWHIPPCDLDFVYKPLYTYDGNIPDAIFYEYYEINKYSLFIFR